MDAAWVSVANLVVTGLLVVFTFIYGKKFSEAKKAEIEAKQAEIEAIKAEVAAKQGVIEAKDALVDNLKREVEALKEINPETLRRYTLAIQEQLNDEIELIKNEKAKLLEELETEKKNSAAQNATIEELKGKLSETENYLNVAQDTAKGVNYISSLLSTSAAGASNSTVIVSPLITFPAGKSTLESLRSWALRGLPKTAVSPTSEDIGGIIVGEGDFSE